MRAKAEYPTPESDESLWEYLHRKDLEALERGQLSSHSGAGVRPVRGAVFAQWRQCRTDRTGLRRVGGPDREPHSGRPRERRGRAQDGRGLTCCPSAIASSCRSARTSCPRCETWEPKVPSLLRNYLRLDPMSRERAIDAVEWAGKAVLDEGVAPCIVDFVGKLDESRRDRCVRHGHRTCAAEPVLLPAQSPTRAGAKIDKALVWRPDRTFWIASIAKRSTILR